MNSEFLKKVEEAYDARDLTLLDSYAKSGFRKINTTQNYSSVLMLSAHKIKHLKKIALLEADCIMLNLEDGVAPEEKPFALVLTAIFLMQHRECKKKLVVRVNALNEGGYDEITYLNQFMPDAIRVPKIESVKEVENVLALLDEKIELHLSIESALAWHNLTTLAPDKRVKAFYLGILDLFADMHLPQSLIKRDNPTLLYMLSHFLVTSKSMGVKPVSFVYQEFTNTQEFTKWLEVEKEMGFEAKGCISPKQVEIVNAFFIDEEEQIQRAKVIVKLFEMHQKEGISGFVDEEYGFIDEPIYKGALSLLANANKG
jgi:citrate lyase subunit beta/citryl-CoA lyase